MNTTAGLPEPELRALRLLVPSYVTLRRSGESVLFTLHAPSTRAPLVTYAINPGEAGFEGDRLATLVEDLHATLLAGLRALPADAGMGEIVSLVGSASVSCSQRLLADGRLVLSTDEIHTVEGEDWVG